MAALLCPAPTAPTTTGGTDSQAPEKLTISFCPCTKRIAVSVKRCNGDDYKYVFNEAANAFRPLSCVSCQPRVMETDLYPFYSIFHAGASQFVTFAYNVITGLWEQYVYNPELELLEQVVIPDLVIDFSRLTTSDLLCTIDTDKGQVVIRKDRNGNFWKERFQKELQMYVPMRSDHVKTIPVDSLEKRKEDSSEERKERPRLSIEYDPHTMQKVIFVTKSRKLLSVFSYNFRTAQFELHHSDPRLSERYLYPKCVSFSKSINKSVIHAKNGMTGEMEQFIYSEKTRGFEQVRVSDIVYDPAYDSKSDVMMVIPEAVDDAKSIVIARHASGYFLKYQINPNSLQYEVMAPVEVRFMSAPAKQDELILDDPDQEAKKGWNLVQELAACAVQKTLDDVNQMLDKTIVEAVESGKVPPNLSEQRGLAVVLKTLCIKHTQEAMKKYDTTLANVKLITVDENLESEAEDASSGVSSGTISALDSSQTPNGQTSSVGKDDELTESDELDSSKDSTIDSDIVGRLSIVTSPNSDEGDSDGDMSTGDIDPDEAKSNDADPKEEEKKEEQEEEAEASKENSLVIVTYEEEEGENAKKEESKPAKNPDDEDVDSDTSMIDMTEFDDEDDDSEEDDARPPQFFHAG